MEMNALLSIISLIGGVLGIIAFFWNVRDAMMSYLHIYLQVQNCNGVITALTTVKNNGVRSKKIDYAFLLVGPESETPADTATRLAQKMELPNPRIKFTNDFIHLRVTEPIFTEDGRAALLPLPFFYSEQVRIGDEELSYRCPVNASRFVPSTVYSVRFFIFTAGRLHRSTHDLMVLSESESAEGTI